MQAPLSNGAGAPASKYEDPLHSAGTRDHAPPHQQLSPLKQQAQPFAEPLGAGSMKSGQKRRPNSYNEFQRQSNSNAAAPSQSQVDLGTPNQASAAYHGERADPPSHASTMLRPVPTSGKPNALANTVNPLGLRNSSQQMMPPLNFVPSKVAGGHSQMQNQQDRLPIVTSAQTSLVTTSILQQKQHQQREISMPEANKKVPALPGTQLPLPLPQAANQH